MSEGTPRIFSELINRLATVRKKENISSLLYGLVLSFSIIIGAVILALLIEQTFYFPVLARTVLFWLIVIASLCILIWFVFRPALKLFNVLPNENDSQTAIKVGSHFPSINDHLVNILQLHKEKETAHLYSPELIDASFEDVRKEIEPVDFTSTVSFAPSRRMGRVLGVIAGVAVLLFVIFPSAFLGSANRLWHFGQSFAAPMPFRFSTRMALVENPPCGNTMTLSKGIRV